MTFHVDAPAGERLRIWDRLEHDLVERAFTGDTSPCVTLGLTRLVGAVAKYPTGLRLARDVEGHDLVLTVDERRIAEVRARDARILELEERLASAARANPLA